MKAFVLGFWIISIALVLSFSVPCYAQVETERFLTPENTGWKINNPEIANTLGGDFAHLGFYAGYNLLCVNLRCVRSDSADYDNRLISHF